MMLGNKSRDDLGDTGARAGTSRGPPAEQAGPCKWPIR